MSVSRTFDLRRILAVSDSGVPLLEGTNARILATSPFGAGDVGRIAVCQAVLDQDEATVVALGVVHEDPAPDDAPLVLRAGAASLALHPDGRIRLEGEDVAVDAARTLRLAGARIDLN
ncbi:hypothetical protein EKE94_05130 [Mesobaculum littorinae]|uniref:Uncharacterized protein n=1 Tax=Mesobaculum littorinae TaxID=2486419 RepID=A0A438AI33_9RHOB|nr:hypothetical protein [Mesobaculum littorinae]RVV98314.1 hypothetical protein EKE94_05130 [Mesobaculum littorinae]